MNKLNEKYLLKEDFLFIFVSLPLLEVVRCQARSSSRQCHGSPEGNSVSISKSSHKGILRVTVLPGWRNVSLLVCLFQLYEEFLNDRLELVKVQPLSKVHSVSHKLNDSSSLATKLLSSFIFFIIIHLSENIFSVSRHSKSYKSTQCLMN